MALPDYEAKRQQHYRWNYWCLLADTAAFAAIGKILNPSVTLAYYLSHFSDATILVALIPAVLTLGSRVSQLFWANVVNGLTNKKRAWVIGTIVSRSSMLLFLAGTALSANARGSLPIWLFFLALSVYAFANGLIEPLWTNFVGKTFPQGRGRFLGYAYFLDAALGVGGAYGLKYVLAAYPFPTSFLLFFAILAVFGLLTILPAVLFQEIPYPVADQAPPIRETLRQIPTILRGYPAFTRYLTCRIVVTFAEMSTHFYTAYAISSMAASAADVAAYAILVVVGALASNLIWGRLGDRFGFMRVFQLGFAVGLINNVLALMATSPKGLYPVLFLSGAYMQSIYMSVVNLNITTSPQDRTALFAGLANTMTGPFLAFTPLLGALITKWIGFRGLLCICICVYVFDILLANGQSTRRQRWLTWLSRSA